MPSTTAHEEKRALRAQIERLPPADYAPLLAQFLALPEVARAETVLLFRGVGREPDTRGVIAELLRRGKTVALPRCLPGRQMAAMRVFADTALVPSAFGIPEPGADCPVIPKDALDLILVPNLCCDAAGYRLGHGGGYYDRYLRDFTGETVALCPAELLRARLPREAFDVPVHLVLST
ncbi:MAG: 5-formyltetrahydrofolate cyclo-ligase [Oscillospiraceae bacterium]|nr:5-formyltetrahydrofolate cyclo-ligase [Oscillospiraceae bacterium]